MIIDTHAHFWSWPTEPEAASEARRVADATPTAHAHGPLTAEDLLEQLHHADVDTLIQVTPTMMRYDNRDGLQAAHRHPDRIRVIGRINPVAPDVDRRVSEAAADRFFVGVRLFELPPNDRWLWDGTCEPLLTACERRAMPVSVYAPAQHGVLLDLALRHPGLPVLVDHAAVHVRDEVPPKTRFEGWQRLGELATLPNITVKVSGMPEATDEPWPYLQAQRRIRELVELFGPDRCMWGSNYPVCGRVSTYRQSLQVVRDACHDLSEGEIGAILGATAGRILRLDQSPASGNP